ncbi:MAG TPA: hypothetical protein VG934_03070 [Candidatus Paceibacterota bacterium]|nr:hypothetical protein [Candidatus Paceibacterota bacterium]
MKKHPTRVEGFDGSLQTLAQRILRMRYDKAVKFIGFCVSEIDRQAEGDRGRGRPKLAAKLEQAAQAAEVFEQKMQEVFDLCTPFMKDELKDD